MLSGTVPTGTDPAHLHTSTDQPAPKMANGKPQRTILVAVDDSEASEAACQWAVDNIVRPGDKVHVTHVAQLPVGALGGFGRIVCLDTPVIYSEETEDREVRASIKAAKDFMLTRFEPRLKDIEHEMEIVHFNKGANAVGEMICERAKDLPAAAVVMARHEKGALQRVFLGSTTTYCTNHCPASLVIPH